MVASNGANSDLIAESLEQARMMEGHFRAKEMEAEIIKRGLDALAQLIMYRETPGAPPSETWKSVFAEILCLQQPHPDHQDWSTEDFMLPASEVSKRARTSPSESLKSQHSEDSQTEQSAEPGGKEDTEGDPMDDPEFNNEPQEMTMERKMDWQEMILCATLSSLQSASFTRW